MSHADAPPNLVAPSIYDDQFPGALDGNIQVIVCLPSYRSASPGESVRVLAHHNLVHYLSGFELDHLDIVGPAYVNKQSPCGIEAATRAPPIRAERRNNREENQQQKPAVFHRAPCDKPRFKPNPTLPPSVPARPAVQGWLPSPRRIPVPQNAKPNAIPRRARSRAGVYASIGSLCAA